MTSIRLIWRARVAVSLLTVSLVLLIFLATQEMFGTGAALLRSRLMVFDPNLLAHGALSAPTWPLLLHVSSVYAFYRYVKVPSLWRLIVVGICDGTRPRRKAYGNFAFSDVGHAGDSLRDSELRNHLRSPQIKRYALAFVVSA